MGRGGGGKTNGWVVNLEVTCMHIAQHKMSTIGPDQSIKINLLDGSSSSKSLATPLMTYQEIYIEMRKQFSIHTLCMSNTNINQLSYLNSTKQSNCNFLTFAPANLV